MIIYIHANNANSANQQIVLPVTESTKTLLFTHRLDFAALNPQGSIIAAALL